MVKALYPGSFDPITYGHLQLIKQSCRIFESVTIAVSVNPAKNYLFTLSERVELLKICLAKYVDNPKIKVATSEGLLADLIKEQHMEVIIKGVRNSSDFDNECAMGELNERLARVPTVLIPASAEYRAVSSSFVKEIGKLGGDTSFMVPPEVTQALQEKFTK